MMAGMLPITLPAAEVDLLMADASSGLELSVDLEAQKVLRPNGEHVSFAGAVDAFKRHCLLNGLDDIGLTMEKSKQIDAFEIKRSEHSPWLDGPGYVRA